MMLDKNLVETKMHERGFSVSSYGMSGEKHIAIHFSANESNNTRFKIPPYGCNIDLVNETFEFLYLVPHSINVLRTPKCSSLMNDAHFDNICAKFESQVSVLYKYFGMEV